MEEKNKFISRLNEALEALENEKPNDRSEKDRKFAIAKTELEKLIAYCEFYLTDK